MLPASDWRPTLLSADLEQTARLMLTNVVLQDVSADSALVDAVQHRGLPAYQLGRLRRRSGQSVPVSLSTMRKRSKTPVARVVHASEPL
jgi:hypothetical protein